MQITPSTQRTPGPHLSSPVEAPAAAADVGGSPGHHGARAELELDGLPGGEEQRVESWLYLSLGLETG